MHIKCWLDHERMENNIHETMIEGIGASNAVVVFITPRYIEKVCGTNEGDNCKLEFKYAARMKTATKMLGVVMDGRVRNPQGWKGPVGFILGGDIYVDCVSEEESSIVTQIEDLSSRIVSKLGGTTIRKALESMVQRIVSMMYDDESMMMSSPSRGQLAVQTTAVQEPPVVAPESRVAVSMNEGSSEAIAFSKFKSWFIEKLQFSASLAEHYVHLLGTKGISGVDRLQRMLNRKKTYLSEWDIEPLDAEDILEKLFPPEAEAVKVAPVKETVVTPKEPVKVAPIVPVEKPVVVKQTFSGTAQHTLTGHSDFVLSVIQLSNGQLASGSRDKTIKIWDIASQTCVATLEGHSNFVLFVIQLSNGQLVSGSADDTIRLWDIASQTCVATLRGHSYDVYSVIQLSNGQLASGSAQTTIKIWDISSMTCVATLRGHSSLVSSVIQLSNGQLASGSHDNTIKVWHVTSQTCVATLTGHSDWVYSVIQLSNGQLASGSTDKTIKLWDIQSQTCVATLEGHSHTVNSVIQLSNGQLVSGSWDQTIKLWDIASQTCVATLKGHYNLVLSVIQLSNGQLASGSADTTIKIWT